MKNILGKLHAIMSEVDYIQKDKRNTFHNYNYASEAAIKARIHESLVKHKVLFQLSCTGQTVTEQTTAKGGKSNLTALSVAYRFWDVESGESLEGTFAAQGSDAEDKGAYKAITGAVKYILTSTFMISTGDDPEGGESDGSMHASGNYAPENPTYEPAPFPDSPVKTTAPKTTPVQEGGKCDKCGAEKKFSQKGKWYCGAKCWLK